MHIYIFVYVPVSDYCLESSLMVDDFYLFYSHLSRYQTHLQNDTTRRSRGQPAHLNKPCCTCCQKNKISPRVLRLVFLNSGRYSIANNWLHHRLASQLVNHHIYCQCGLRVVCYRPYRQRDGTGSILVRMVCTVPLCSPVRV